MTAQRWRRNVWMPLAAAAAVSSSLSTASAPGQGVVPPSSMRLLGEADVVFDGRTTYCWGVNANVSSSNVTDDLVFLRGSGAQCPLELELTIGSTQIFVNQVVEATWTVSPSKSDSAIISLANTPALIDKRTRSRVTIIHSNVHTCHFGSRCDPFRQGQTDTNATTNQIGNLSDATTFTSNEIKFMTPGKRVVLAHIIVPATSFDARFDFAVFTTVDVLSATEEAGETTVQSNGSGPPTSDAGAATPSSIHKISHRQIVVLIIVGALLLGLLVVVVVYSAKTKNQFLCFQKRNDRDSMASKVSNYCVHGSHMRTRSSDWTELYAIDDMLPTTVVGDEGNAIAIMRASRASTPNSSPSSPSSHDRKVADFRHDVARWDERSSASPITPSSSAILIAGFHDPDMISNTPANDCFVPLESLVLASPPSECVRPASPLARWKKPFRRHKKQQRATQPPDDSGDETEVDI